MTEPFPRRPRVLGSPRSVALAKEGVPPEWEPGCGAPRRRRPVGRERQPGATGHVTSGPGHRTRRGGAPRATGRALAAGSPKARGSSPPWRECPGLPAASRDRPVGMEERLPRVRRRADQRGREEGRCDAAHACAEVRPARYLGTTDIAHGSRARCASVSTHTAPSPSGPSRICGGRPKRFTSRMRFGPCPLPRGAPGVVRVVVPVVEGDHSCPVELRARPWGRRREERHTGVWPTSYRPDRFAGVSQVVRG